MGCCNKVNFVLQLYEMGKHTHNDSSGTVMPLMSGLELYNIMMWEIEPCLTSDRIDDTKAQLKNMTDGERLEELARFTQAFIICAEALEELNVDLKFESDQWKKVMNEKLTEITGAEESEMMKKIEQEFNDDSSNV